MSRFSSERLIAGLTSTFAQGRPMKIFHNAQITFDEKSVFLKLAPFPKGLVIESRDAILELSRDGIPLGFELFGVSAISVSHLNSIALALQVAAVPFSLNEEVDILTVNVNAIDEAAVTQAPGVVHFGFSSNGELATIVATLKQGEAD
jgi:hypothetical protein